MYQTYFGLVEAPFSIAPDPRYLYMSQRHQEALATLLYGVSGDGGFVLLTGEVGAGKTTICRCLLEQVPDACDVAYIFNPKLTVDELLSTICDEFGIAYPQGTVSIKQFVDLINAYLLEAHARGRRAVLIIDEAQNLSADVLEQMRLLTNLETSQRKLLQILLLGQPELMEMLARPELRQLAQRVVARYHLRPLNKHEVAAYVRHRLEVSGAQRQLFPDALLGKLYRLSGGVPRVINVLCDRALLGTFVQGKERVDRATLAQAAREVLNPRFATERFSVRRILTASTLILLMSVAVATFYWPWRPDVGVAAARKVMVKPVLPVVVPHIAVPPKPEVPPEAAKPVTVLPTALELPSDVLHANSRELAFATLFLAWNASYRSEDDSCRQAATMGLQCRTARGGLEELRQLNLPAILHMQDGHGQMFYATLTGLGATSATFAFGTESREVALGAMGLQWTGDYTLLLHLPTAVHENLLAGERSPTVTWLSKQLAQVDGMTGDVTAPAVFDDQLKRRIKQFQLAQGLTPDGTVGPRTLMRLSALADPSAPRLSHGKGGQ